MEVIEGRGNEVLTVAVLFFCLAWITVSLRVYVRAIMLKTWGWDDWAMSGTLLVFTIYITFQIVAAVYGIGRHRWELNNDNARIALFFWYLCELLYVLTNCLLKISLGIFYLRVAVQRWHIWVIRILVAGTVFIGACYFFLLMFQCVPVTEFWNNHPASARCIPHGPTLASAYTFAAVNITADFIFGTLPIFIVWDLPVNRRTKALVGGILAFAAIGSTGTLARIKYIPSLFNGPDFLWATTDVALWSTIEHGIGITAASLATLRPLLQEGLWRFGFASEPSSHRQWTANHSSRSEQQQQIRIGYVNFGHAQLVPTHYGSTITTVSSPARPTRSVIGEIRSINDTKFNEEQMAEANSVFRNMLAEQEPPRLPHFRDSLRNSFLRGSIFSSKTFKNSDSSTICSR